MNPLVYTPVIRALFRALDRWVADGVEPPPSRYPTLADGTLTRRRQVGLAGDARGTRCPQSPMTTYRLDFGPEWSKGIVTKEPPGIGKPFVGRVPAVDDAGNDRAGIRLPEIAVPLATHTGWNYRQASIGAPDRLASEIGSYLPLPRTRADREKTGDGRKSIAERYASREDYLGRISLAALALVDDRLPARRGRARDHRTRQGPLRVGHALARSSSSARVVLHGLAYSRGRTQLCRTPVQDLSRRTTAPRVSRRYPVDVGHQPASSPLRARQRLSGWRRRAMHSGSSFSWSASESRREAGRRRSSIQGNQRRPRRHAFLTDNLDCEPHQRQSERERRVDRRMERDAES